MIYPWLQTQWQQLVQTQRMGGLAHAYLFSGPAGIGKEDFAQASARFLLCQQNEAIEYPGCGHCPSCQLFDAKTHPDILIVEPIGASQTIQVDQIRSLIEYLSLKPHQAARKIAIIKAADRMNANAANSLLKSLEEPPPASMLILSTCHGSRLLPTIKSRCQQITFSVPDADISRPWLAARLEKEAQAELFLQLAQGAPLRAVELADVETMSQRTMIYDDLQALLAKKADVLAVVKRWTKLDTQIPLAWMRSFVFDMARLKVAEYPPAVNNPDFAQAFRQLCASMSLQSLLSYLAQVQNASRFAQGNMNRELLFEELLFNWVDLGRNKKHLVNTQ
ncbi:MAG: DNA polymerase III subunit delta' [Gammaproteobacteria bacterium]|nr:DNA polymerase III subunit delta' [Gammaproteobacteria bacterium]